MDSLLDPGNSAVKGNLFMLDGTTTSILKLIKGNGP